MLELTSVGLRTVPGNVSLLAALEAAGVTSTPATTSAKAATTAKAATPAPVSLEAISRSVV